MELPPSTLTAEGIVHTLIRHDYYNKSSAYRAILFCNATLKEEATILSFSDLRGRYILTYSIDGLIKSLTIRWDEDDYRFLPAHQSSHPHQAFN